jgi:hypothetical protein
MPVSGRSDPNVEAGRHWRPARDDSDAGWGEVGKERKVGRMVDGSKIVPVYGAGTRRSARRRARNKRKDRRSTGSIPEEEVATQEISEIFDMDDGESDDFDLIDLVLRRGPIRGRRL